MVADRRRKPTGHDQIEDPLHREIIDQLPEFAEPVSRAEPGRALSRAPLPRHLYGKP
jgi:hypothetical protein